MGGRSRPNHLAQHQLLSAVARWRATPAVGTLLRRRHPGIPAPPSSAQQRAFDEAEELARQLNKQKRPAFVKVCEGRAEPACILRFCL